MIIAIEGSVCWIMASPFFIIFGMLGGVAGGWIRRKRHPKVMAASILILPILISPIENYWESHPTTYRAVTSIEINAPAKIIWDNVTRVDAISRNEDSGVVSRLLGLPRPVEAVLDKEAVGGHRVATFTRGLYFDEVVTAYRDNEEMEFTISVDPTTVPPDTMDEHIIIGGTYFDVLTGRYELEEMPSGKCRLHLESRFSMNTRFNWYSGWWAQLIMRDIQNNILRVQKNRSENRS